MAISEEGRYRMHQRFEEVLGSETATMLMEHLPPVGWADVATKRDLDMLRLEMRAEIYRSSRSTILAMSAVNSVLAGLIVAAARLV